MTGPPTPPITSAIEIEDAARAANAVETPEASGSATATAAAEVVGSVPVQAVSLGTPEQAATPFRRVFATLAELAAQGKFGELVEEAEVADLSVRIPISHIWILSNDVAYFRQSTTTKWIAFW